MPKKQLELLAPAKNLESGKLAINAGADAVYIGARQFGARQAARNSITDIEKLSSYAHKYWGRVYVTLNTLLYDDELEEAVQLCHQLHQAGVDALIIQDYGLLESDLPPIPLFASTQMHNHTPERVAFLEQVGFQRVILARELSLEEITNIRAVTKIELETFIHGSLCVSYSGQCALSYAIGGRSGNRGQCAQPCRHKYSLIDSHGKTLIKNSHLLSLKDLNLTDYLRDLIAAGVCSFKIEGRLKDQAYVKNIVGHYRQHLDAILPDFDLSPSSSNHVVHGFDPAPIKTFQRGYTSYFLTGQRDNITSFDTPKNAGESIGIVTAVGANSFSLNTHTQLHNGDGLTFFNQKKELMGTLVNSVNGKNIYPAKMDGIHVGTQIRRNVDRKFLKLVENSQPERKVIIKLKFSETPTGFALLAQDSDSNQAIARLSGEKIPAKKADQALVTLKRQLTRLGESDFVCNDFEIDVSQAYFFPFSTLNALRRELVDNLIAERAKNFLPMKGNVIQNDVPYPENKLTFLGNVLNNKAKTFYRKHGVTEIEPAAESGLTMNGRKVMTTKHCLKYELDACPHQKHPVQLDEPLFLVDDTGAHLRLDFNCKDCLMEIYFEARNSR